MKKKICFVVQRYGIQINGGAETHCRMIAEHMTDKYEIAVLTTKAMDYMTWKDVYQEEKDCLNGVNVIRFSVKHPRDQKRFDRINAQFMARHKIDEARWLEEQGPLVPDLLQYIRDHQEEYCCFVFFTYLYYPSVMGIREVKEKAILVPDAHKEPFLRMKQYRQLFCSPRAYFFNTEEERKLVVKKFHTQAIPYRIGGIGIEIPQRVDLDGFLRKYQPGKYILYAGRVDYGKNCPVLFRYFQKYKKRNPGELKLVLVGEAVMDVPTSEDIVSLGFVSEEEKFAAMKGAECLVLPSRHESLSIVVLETMKLATPVLVNGKSDVLKAHCRKSGGGLYYRGYYDFERKLRYLLTHSAKRRQMGAKGKRYVQEHYQWKSVTEGLEQLIDML